MHRFFLHIFGAYTLCICLLTSTQQLFAETAQVIPFDYIILTENTTTYNSLMNVDFADFDLQAVKPLSPNFPFFHISAINSSVPTDEVLSQLREHPDVLLAQHNSKVTMRSGNNTNVPNDEFYNMQWHLSNNGSWDDSANDADIDADNAWQFATGGTTANGDTLVIAVIDNGFDLLHSDLNFWINHGDPANGFDDDNNGYIDDHEGWNVFNNSDFIPVDEHGTHVCGIAAAKGNNEIGIAGVNWQLKILPVVGASENQSDVVEAYLYIASVRQSYNTSFGTKGAMIVASNSSFGVDFGTEEDFPIWCAMYDTLGHLGVLNIAATINDNINIDLAGDIPSSCSSDFLITVTNTTKIDDINSNAGFGVNTIDIGAPGTGIWSTIPNEGYSASGWTGTSLASPQVSSTVALIFNMVCGDWLNDYIAEPTKIIEVKESILGSAEFLPGLENKTSSDGRLNIAEAIDWANNRLCFDCFEVGVVKRKATCGLDNGSITLELDAISIPFTIQWSNGVVNQSVINDLAPGTYTYSVTDASGCVFEGSTTLEAAPELVVLTSIVTPSSSTSADGQISAELGQGIGPYNIVWDGPVSGTGSSLNNLVFGSYTMTATDGWGCERLLSFALGVVGQESHETKDLSIFPNPTSDKFVIPLPDVLIHKVEVFNINGKRIHFSQGQSEIFTNAWPEGVYTVVVTENDTRWLDKLLIRK